MPPRLLLASTSPYRRALLERLRVPFEAVAPHVDETPRRHEPADALAARLAQAKAEAVAAGNTDAIVVGSDQVAVLDGRLLGKPGNHDAALEQLMTARGRAVVFHTAVCVCAGSGQTMVENVPTVVHYRNYSEEWARRYLEVEQPYDCAGSAKIEALGIALVERVDSADPTALIGLPLIALVGMLKRAGLDVPVF